MQNQARKIQCVVSYDVITKWDRVDHKVETVVAQTRASLFKYLRIKNKARGLVRNICVESEVAVA